MKFRVLISLALSTMLMSCDSPKKKPAKTKDRSPITAPDHPAKEETGDVAFQSFISRLRIAAAARDLPTLASMMPSNFGHRWDTPPLGESAFEYWDQHNLWPELIAILNSQWTPHDGFMVAPPQMIQDPAYSGFRAGVAMTDGSWKFSYFVPKPPAE